MADVAPTVQRIVIPHTSWSSTIFIWIVRLVIQHVRTIQLAYASVPTPSKGPQTWAFPPPTKHLDRLMKKGEHPVVGQWKDESTGWVMTTLLPPSVDKTSNSTSRTIFYIAGCAFQLEISTYHWGHAAYLARELDAEVVIVPHPLAPTNNASEVMPALTKVYEAFLKRANGREVIFAGDSSGGAIVFGLAIAAHDAGLPLPSQILAMSPVVNLEMNNPDMIDIEKVDGILNREYLRKIALQWAGVPIPSKPANKTLYSVPFPPEILSNPHINPYAADLGILAGAGTKAIIVSGTYDCLHAEIVPFVKRLEEAGVHTTYIEGEHQFHDFTMIVDGTAESKEAAELINQCIINNGT